MGFLPGLLPADQPTNRRVGTPGSPLPSSAPGEPHAPFLHLQSRFPSEQRWRNVAVATDPTPLSPTFFPLPSQPPGPCHPPSLFFPLALPQKTDRLSLVAGLLDRNYSQSGPSGEFFSNTDLYTTAHDFFPFPYLFNLVLLRVQLRCTPEYFSLKRSPLKRATFYRPSIG